MKPKGTYKNHSIHLPIKVLKFPLEGGVATDITLQLGID